MDNKFNKCKLLQNYQRTNNKIKKINLLYLEIYQKIKSKLQLYFNFNINFFILIKEN